jgi:hypothetical protein
MRVLVTGSRSWTDRELIYRILRAGRTRYPDLVIVHGACPTGADRIADEAATDLYLGVERHPADWQRLGRRAGYVRNAEMVDTKPDLCLAFIHNNSRGASMCADLAEKAGIRTFRYTRETTL